MSFFKIIFIVIFCDVFVGSCGAQMCQLIEHAMFDQSVQIEQLNERMATGFSDIRNQLTEMFNQLRHQ